MRCRQCNRKMRVYKGTNEKHAVCFGCGRQFNLSTGAIQPGNPLLVSA